MESSIFGLAAVTTARDGRITVIYWVMLRCEAMLDHRGFLFDQLTVDQFFRDIKETNMSCERLAMVCVDQLVEALKKENPRLLVKEVLLELSPDPFEADISCRKEF